VDVRFEVVETERFTAEAGTTIGGERWAELKPALVEQLARNPHRFTQIANTPVYSIPLITGHALYFTIDFNHARVTLWRLV
jgi:hypothetical protein